MATLRNRRKLAQYRQAGKKGGRPRAARTRWATGENPTLYGVNMKTLAEVTASLQERIKAARKKPQTVRPDMLAHALGSMQPYGVVPARVWRHAQVITDGTCLAIYIAICMHANKAGITKVGQERLATLTRKSRKTVGRKLKVLIEAGLIKIEYRRPTAGDGVKKLNIMRVIHDDGTMNRHEVQAIAQPIRDTMHVPLAKQAAGKPETAPQAGHSECPPYPQVGHPNPPQVGHLDHFPSGTPSMSRGKNKFLKNRDILQCLNQALIRFNQKPIEATESDIMAINGTSLTEQDITGAVADYLLDCQDARQAAQPSIHAILGNVLQAH